MKLAPIIECLRENCPSFERRVFGAYAWFNIDDSVSPAMPCAFVLPSGVTAETATTSTKYRQLIENHFSINICVSLTSDDALGKTGHDYLEDLKEEVFKAVLGLPLGYPEQTNRIIYFESQSVNTSACNRARLVETLDFAYGELLMGSVTAQQRIIDSLPILQSVRLKAKDFSTTDEDDKLVTAELLTK